MKVFMLLSLIVVLTSSISFASDRYSNEVGVQAIARNVIEKKLVNKSAQNILRAALETGKVDLGDMTCDRALGADICSFDVFVKDDESTPEAEEALYHLDVRLRQGTLVSAALRAIAGQLN